MFRGIQIKKSSQISCGTGVLARERGEVGVLARERGEVGAILLGNVILEVLETRYLQDTGFLIVAYPSRIGSG
ncbi:MAG: hypothetical protein SAK29_06960 [Scytonema sp. PMC 1069.18]|nr:hypothetical protein [Scytonema sp. PMC 1069.18]MEC4880712.1 hypothetical protein [Scytonema sp. PMC 1070.18]